MIKTDLSGIAPFVTEEELSNSKSDALAALSSVLSGQCRGSDFLGWVRFPDMYDRDELQRIKDAAAKMKQDSSAVVVIGIGGSYIGARAALELVRSPNYNVLPKSTPDLYFAGNNLSGRHIKDIIRMIGDRDFSINVISKSGTTTEPAVAFRVFRALLEEKYGKEDASKRIYATTDKSRGALKAMAAAEGWQCFTVPDDIGGRYSVLTPVGLLPMAIAGIDPTRVLVGAFTEMTAIFASSDNAAINYAAARHALAQKGFRIEILAGYEPGFRMMAEWWKQLFGESEGKEGKGLFLASVDYTADLHSMGQYIQDGPRNLIETTVLFGAPEGNGFRVPPTESDMDGLSYLAGMELCKINSVAADATKRAHIFGGVPCIDLQVQTPSEEVFGALCYFFEAACAISGTMLGVNPFDQPGVEEYKRNMFALLGRPGYEEMRENLLKQP